MNCCCSLSLNLSAIMKLKKGSILTFLDFDTVYCLLSVRNTKILVDYFRLLDVHKKNMLNDIQFYHFMHHVSDLKKHEIMHTFDMLDWDARGHIGFDQFYMLVCILLSNEYHVEKNFLFRYSRPVFECLDVDGSRTITPAELRSFGFLFNLKGPALGRIFRDFDVSGDEKLNYKEFKMFTMACLDMQKNTKRIKCQIKKVSKPLDAEDQAAGSISQTHLGNRNPSKATVEPLASQPGPSDTDRERGRSRESEEEGE